MTKSEILDKTHWEFVVDHGISSIHSKTFPGAYKEQAEIAMDQYSRQMAIAFAEWLKEETLDKEPVSGKWITYDHGDKTSEELYNLFLQHQSQQS